MFDPVLLRSFVAAAQTRSFTEAARRLGLQQSTVSQHIRKLEEAAGRRLFVRDTHNVALSADGEAMLGFARSILETGERARRYFEGSKLRGRLRFGVSEDFVLSGLPEILRDFTRIHPLVDLELTVDVSGTLYQRMDAGELDLVFAKRRTGEDDGRFVWRSPLVWIGAEQRAALDPAQPVPLLVLAPPSITRLRALEALEAAGRAWRIVCTSSSLTGVRAAALAGLGIAAHARNLIPAGMSELPAAAHLPDLGSVDFVLRHPGGPLRSPARELAEALIANSDRLQQLAA
jgi:DNA-binding transcriptional LysR family regulator